MSRVEIHAVLGSLTGTIGIDAANAADIAREISALAPRIRVVQAITPENAGAIEALITWSVGAAQLASMPDLRLIQANGAGVDGILSGLGHRSMLVCRTVDVGVASGMKSYVVWAVLDHLRKMDHYRQAQEARRWSPSEVVLPLDHRVGIAGAGETGRACAEALVHLGFPVSVWARTHKPGLDANIRQYIGDEGLHSFLGMSDCLVCMLPLTDRTVGFLGRSVFESLPPGAHVVNVGRGMHLVEEDLLAAMALGQVSRATLDVSTTEPLPSQHRFWGHPGIVLTPHVAARASARSVALQALTNMLAVKTGTALTNQVDADGGY